MPKIIFVFSCLFNLFYSTRLFADAKIIEDLIVNWRMDEARKALYKYESSSEYLNGLYEFYSGNYASARQHFNNCGEDNMWLNIIESIMPVTEEFKQLETEYFIIRYAGKDEIVALYLKPVLDVVAERLYGEFAWKPSEKVILEIYPDRESFQAASTLSDKHIKVSGAIGICKFNRLMLASPRILKFGYRWVDTAVHEYVHYIIGKITGLKNMPLWLNEGLAKNMEKIWKCENGKLDPVDVNYLIKSRVTGQWVDFEKMKYGMPSLDTRDEVALAFAQVQSIAGFLISKCGMEKIRSFLYGLRNGTADDLFVDIYGKTVEEIWSEWVEYIDSADMEAVPGASGPSYAFSEDPANAVTEWVSETALTDIKIGDRFREKGRNELAARKYINALEKDPGNAVILNKLAKIYIHIGETEKAKISLRHAIQTNPSYAPPYIHMGELLYNENNFTEAERYFLEYIYICPFNPESHKLLMNLYDKIGDEKNTDKESNILNILTRHGG